MERLSPTAAYARSTGLPARLGLVGDERLAKLVGTGTECAFVALYERYHQPLYRYCRSILKDECDAQDALQSTFAAAFAALTRGQRDAPLRPWLFRIAHNEAISVIRRRRAAGSELVEGLEPLTASAEERSQERERLALLVADLQQLPDRQRSALVMRELSGLSHREIAVALGTTVGTAKLAIFEARSALLEFAEGRAMDCEAIRRTISDGDRRALRGRRIRAHLRDCGACAAFAAAIPARTSDLHAIALPLAPLAAAGMLAHLTAGGSAHTAAGGGGAGSLAGTVATKVAGAGLATKAVAAAVVVTGAAAGVTGALSHPSHPRTRAAPARISAPSMPATARTGAATGPGAHALVTPGARGSAAARSSHAAAARARSAGDRGAHSGSQGGAASGLGRAHDPAGLPTPAGSAHHGDHGRPSSAGARPGQAATPVSGRGAAGQRGTERRSQGQDRSRAHAGAAPSDRRSATGSARAGSGGAGSGTAGRPSSQRATTGSAGAGSAGGGSAGGSAGQGSAGAVTTTTPAGGGSPGTANGAGSLSSGETAVGPSGGKAAGGSDTNSASAVGAPNPSALQRPSAAASQ